MERYILFFIISHVKFIDNPKKSDSLKREYQQFAEKAKLEPKKFIMISASHDLHLLEHFRKLELPLYTSELLLTGLLRQELLLDDDSCLI